MFESNCHVSKIYPVSDQEKESIMLRLITPKTFEELQEEGSLILGLSREIQLYRDINLFAIQRKEGESRLTWYLLKGSCDLIQPVRDIDWKVLHGLVSSFTQEDYNLLAGKGRGVRRYQPPERNTAERQRRLA
ncbi:hypothetical protein ACTFR4_12555 [Bacillus cereus group sp. MYBK181-1]|uniref:hypothetical protein n=1 Tax=unclassified Bacillus cereus group TaxID=2750818 RepID=UPI003F793D35